MKQGQFIDAITAALDSEPSLRGLFLVGSFGKGTADAYSDIDLLAIVDETRRAAFPALWRSILEGIAPVVFWSQRQAGGILINAITADWLRCDLVIAAGDRVDSNRSQDTVRALIDRDGLYETLPPQLAYSGPNIGRVTYLINEFIRVLGLTSVVVGRGEYFTAVVGAGLQRDHLASLMVEEARIPDPGGALHLSRLISATDMSILTGLPYPTPDHASVVQAHLETARRFMPRARAVAAALGIAWPEPFEQATLHHLRKAFGREFDVSW